MELPLGWGERLSTPKSSSFFNDGRGYFGGRGIAHLPPSSHFRGGLLPHLRGLRRRKDWHLSLPPHNSGEYFGGEGTGPSPRKVGVCFGGGRTGLPPRTVGVHLMPLAEENDELNILYSLTYRAVTVEGDRQIVTSAVRQSVSAVDFVKALNNLIRPRSGPIGEPALLKNILDAWYELASILKKILTPERAVLARHNTFCETLGMLPSLTSPHKSMFVSSALCFV